MNHAPALAAAERSAFGALAFELASAAARELMAGYRTRPVVDHKGRTDLVTEFDRLSERLIGERLRAATPDIPVVGEELSADDAHRAGLAWYVDPLDGTTNFVHGHPFFCVAVGLVRDALPIVGAVVAPALGVSWRGDAAGGAWRDGVPCRVSATDALLDALVATGFPQARECAPDDNFDSFVRVKRACRGVRRCGSAAIDACLVADGTFDAYWERALHPWDTLASAAVALGAGARITALDGGPPDYHRGNIVVSNGRVHDALCAAIRGS